MEKSNFVKVNNNLFAMAIMFSAGAYFSLTFPKVIELFSHGLDFVFKNTLYSFWITGVGLVLVCSIVGIYLFLVKEKINNTFLYVFLVIYTVHLYIYGHVFSFTIGGLDYPIVNENIKTGYGFGLSGWGVFLFLWYLIIVQRSTRKTDS